MGIFAISCPQCGGRLDVTRGADLATCSYCSTTSRVGKHTREVKIPNIPEAPSHAEAPSHPPPVIYPDARRDLNGGARLARALLLVVAAGAGGWAILGGVRAHSTAAANLSLDGLAAPLLADVDGEGTVDALLRTRYVSDGDRMHLAAVSGQDGHLLWESEPLGTYMETYQDRLMLAGERVLVGEQSGALSGWQVRDGKRLWRTELGERTQIGCSAEGDSVLIGTVDKRWHRVALADGRRTDASAPTPCEPLSIYSNVNPAQAGVETATRQYRNPDFPDAIEGMQLDRYVRRRPDGPWLALGTRSPGTGAPMLALVENGAPRWTTLVPERPLEAEARAPEYVWLSNDSVVVTYKTGTNSTLRVARFAITAGLRLWDSAVPEGLTSVLSGLTGDTRSVWVALWGRLECFDLTTGAHRFTVGK